ncbi:MAG: cytochrome c [Elusimicrobia bacterium]|nr:cytochrome c [Elusimicrobiota bacterium]
MRWSDYGTPEDYRRMAGALAVVLIALAGLAVFDIIVIPGLRGGAAPYRGPDAPLGKTGWLDVSEQPATRGYMPAPVDLRALERSTPRLLERGRTIFARVCAPCHGPQGRADGPAASSLRPPPRDFTRPTGWKNGYGPADIFQTISRGVPGSAMASFDYLPAEDRIALARFEMSLGKFPHPAQKAKIEKLAEGFKSERVPNKIPVSLAMEKLEQEASKIPDLGEAGAPAVLDRPRAALWLSRSTAWRAGPRALAEAACLQAQDNGFSTSAAALSAGDWRRIYGEFMAWRRES